MNFIAGNIRAVLKQKKKWLEAYRELECKGDLHPNINYEVIHFFPLYFNNLSNFECQQFVWANEVVMSRSFELAPQERGIANLPPNLVLPWLSSCVMLFSLASWIALHPEYDYFGATAVSCLLENCTRSNLCRTHTYGYEV